MYILARTNYLFFHAIVEGFAIIVALLIYVLASRTYQYSRNETFLLLGISYLYVAFLDFFHTLTYKGMNIFPEFGSDTPTQLWIAGRMMEALSLLIVLFLHRKKIERKFTHAVYLFITAGILLSIMVFRNFPVCFVEGEGLTFFKVLCEYIIIVILLASSYIIHMRKDCFDPTIFRTVKFAMIITAVSEFSFTLYTDVYGVANMLGHLIKIFSYYVIYRGVVAQGIDEPFRLIAEELKEKALRDGLTGLYNHQGMLELIENELEKGSELGLLMIDLDNFKLVNDNYGHMQGDLILKQFGSLLKKNIGEQDAACRFGGDEFVVLVSDALPNRLEMVKQNIQAATESWINQTPMLKGVGISIGMSLSQKAQFQGIDSLLKSADKSMYDVKRDKKFCVNPALNV